MTKKYLITILKIIISVILIYLVINAIDLTKISSLLGNVNYMIIAVCILFLLISNLVSAFRMQRYFNYEELSMPYIVAVKYYFIGLLFNFLLPSGIGGDGYKAYLLKKNYDISLMRIIQRLISERANGLYILLIATLIICYFIMPLQQLDYASLLITIAIIIITLTYFLAARKILAEKTSLTVKILPYSLIIQLLHLVISMLLFNMLGIDNSILLEYLLLFQVSSILSIVPISIGSIGLREITFIYGAKILPNITPEIGVIFCLIYYFTNFLVALTGAKFYLETKS
ncbi:MAG: lysylphosphatidylglycerol synthase transmembrane domain-containing protein [Pseudomonadota bacterium]